MSAKSSLNILFVTIVAFCAWNCSDLKPMISSIGNSFGDESPVSEVDVWKQDVKEAFDLAESEILEIKPVPDVVGPDPDPKKCICKGSGIIVQGDGHKTPCPYHSKMRKLKRTAEENNLIIEHLLILE
tara:strand:+ start:754 stop:1137 length:384 start_codon:yes stop_codon:yes gene_type:complete